MQSPTLKPCEASNAQEQLCLMFVTSIKVSWIGSFVKTLENKIKVGIAKLERGFAVSSHSLPPLLHFQHLWVEHCTILSNNSFFKALLLFTSFSSWVPGKISVFGIHKVHQKVYSISSGKKFPRARSWRRSFCIKHWARQDFAACIKDLRNLSRIQVLIIFAQMLVSSKYRGRVCAHYMRKQV